jgi:PAS domain S-box-containing protein
MAREGRKRDRERSAAPDILSIQNIWLETISSQLSDGVIAVNDDQNITLFNTQAEAIFGYTVDEVIGQPLSILLPPGAARRHKKDVDDFRKGEAQLRSMGRRAASLQARHKDGHLIPVGITIARLDLGGQSTGVALVREMNSPEKLPIDEWEHFETFLKATQQQARALAVIGNVRSALAGQFDAPELFRLVVEAVASGFGYTNVSLYAVDGDRLVLKHQIGYSDETRRFAEIPLDKGILGRAVRTGTPILVEDVSAEPDFLQATDNLVSEIAVPLVDQGVIVGGLNIESSDGKRLTHADLSLMMGVADHLAIGLRQARLYEQLQDSEERYRRLVEESGDTLYTATLDGQFTYVNAQAEQLSGYSTVDLLSLRYLDLVDPAWRARTRSFYRRQIIRRIAETILEFPIITKSGQTKWVEQAVTLQAEAGRPTGLQGIARDITRRKQAEIALQESEQRYSSVITSMAEGVFLQDAAGVIITANPQAGAILGAPSEKLIGHSVIDMHQAAIHVDGTPYADDEYPANRALKTGKPQSDVVMGLHRPDGSLIWVSINAQPILGDRSGMPSGVVTSMIDITSRRHAEEALLRQNKYLEALNETALGLIAQLDVHQLLNDILARAAALLKCENGYLELINPERNVLENRVALGRYQDETGYSIPYGKGLSGLVWKSGQTMKIEDYQHWPSRLDGFNWVRGIIAAPLKSGDQVIGVMGIIADEDGRKFDEEERAILERFSHLVSLALQSAALYQTEREARTFAESVSAVTTALGSKMALDEVLNNIFDNIGRVVPHDSVNMMLIEDGHTRTVGQRGYSERGLHEDVMKMQLSLDSLPGLKEMIETHKPLRIADVRDREEWVATPASKWIRSYLSTPIIIDDEVIGFLNLDSATPGFFTDAHARRLEAFASQAGIAIQNARLYQRLSQELEDRRVIEQELESYAGEIMTLYRASERLYNPSTSLHEQAQHIARVIVEELSVEYCGILMADSSMNSLEMVGQAGSFNATEFLLALDDPGLLTTAYHQKTPVYAPDVRADSRYVEIFPEVRSKFVIPLRSLGAVIGLIDLESTQLDALDERMRRQLVDFADRVALALNNARLIERLERARYYAEAANRTKSEFLANMSHEIRTPLNGVIGMIDIALESPQVTSELSGLLNGARASGVSLLDLINDLLDLSKIEAGRMEIEMIDFDLRTLVDQAIQTVHPRAANKGLKLATTIESGIPSILQGDPTRLRQVLLNLLGNAVKFTHAGSVELMVGIRKQTQSGVTLLFAVKDTGIGIPENQQHSIFEPFVQGDGSTTRQYGGTGLGLSISRRIVESMGGILDLKSTAGSGSTFSFEITFAYGKKTSNTFRTEAEQLVQPAIIDLGGRRILLAEDNEINQRVMVRLLERRGSQVDIAEDGEQAVRMATEGDYHLAIMDIQMPKMDGLNATRAIRKFEGGSGRHLPIIALTAHAMAGDRERCLEAGMDDYLSKPVTPPQMDMAIAQLLNIKDASHASAVAPAASTEPFDLARALVYAGEDIKVVHEVVAMFRTIWPETFRRLETALAEGDLQTVQMLAHRFKGQAGLLAAGEVRNLSTAIEENARGAHLSALKVLVPQLKSALERLDKALQKV